MYIEKADNLIKYFSMKGKLIMNITFEKDWPCHSARLVLELDYGLYFNYPKIA